MHESRPKLICVDDHEGVVGGMRITLRKLFTVHSATDGPSALALLASEPDFSAIITDMRMPGMDGVEVLRRARDISPKTQRILLTGFADADSAIAAVNEGAVFRYLTKPCSPPDLREVCGLAHREYQALVELERVERMRVHSTVALIADVLILARPEVAGISLRVDRMCHQVGRALGVDPIEDLRSAARLHPLARSFVGQRTAEQIASTPAEDSQRPQLMREVAARAIERWAAIPGSQRICDILRASTGERSFASDDTEAIALAGRIVECCALVTDLEQLGWKAADAARHVGENHARLAPCLDALDFHAVESVVPGASLELATSDIRPGMVMSRDLETSHGSLLVSAGTAIRDASHARIVALPARQLPENVGIETHAALVRPPEGEPVSEARNDESQRSA